MESNSRSRAPASSAAVSTSTRRMPGSACIETLAATRVTSAPRRAARSARASPIRPEERLPMKRTGSIGSRVPPAETSTRRPSQGPIGPGAACSIASSSARGSGNLPTPCSPREASAPSSGSITVMPRCRSVARLACVAASRYIRSFIAGATSRGASQARNDVVSIESAIPAASLAMVFADAGATRYASALATTSRWPIGSCSGTGSPGKAPRAGSRSNSSMRTGAPTIPSNEALPMNFSAVGVISDADRVPLLGGEASQLQRLVGGDSAAHPEQDAGHQPSLEARPCTRT